MRRLRPFRHLLPLALCATALSGQVVFAASPAASPAQGGSHPTSSSPHVGEPLQPSNAEQQALSEHLRRRGALFYGAWWCPACFQQKNLFGQEAGSRLPYVECDKTEEGRARCSAAKIRAYPTWDLPGQPRQEGVQTLDELKRWSGFQDPVAPTTP